MRETLRVDTSTVSSKETARVSEVRSSEKLSNTGPVLSGSKAVTGRALSVSLGITWFPAMSETSSDEKLRKVVRDSLASSSIFLSPFKLNTPTMATTLSPSPEVVYVRFGAWPSTSV